MTISLINHHHHFRRTLPPNSGDATLLTPVTSHWTSGRASVFFFFQFSVFFSAFFFFPYYNQMGFKYFKLFSFSWTKCIVILTWRVLCSLLFFQMSHNSISDASGGKQFISSNKENIHQEMIVMLLLFGVISYLFLCFIPYQQSMVKNEDLDFPLCFLNGEWVFWSNAMWKS